MLLTYFGDKLASFVIPGGCVFMLFIDKGHASLRHKIMDEGGGFLCSFYKSLPFKKRILEQ